ncbi:RnfABCDGE type electron transport complex subunit D [Streptomyces sp. ST2-7A]|uniref:RnfABCDGE type electron transport complex subunit D n=1 Tax=Streptomyces sp. ST2-7A TaxID=2907214 RepID=UPI001F3EC8EA|nr:RnfABCDGE type electron transport complex subunit D [Streptomyces sp. ST2-7A]MCE7079502.1 RnfABCDGE type electron transport complex subunit D [Streptomyces sp. ST2-7A]
MTTTPPTPPTSRKAATPYHSPKIVKALRRFAISISVLNILGYTVLGFEQPWTWPLVALLTAYTTEIVLEIIAARVDGRTPRFLGNGRRGFMEFLYPAHITGLAVNMLIYVNDMVWGLVFGVIVAIGAKWVLRAPVRGRMRHFMNPSNLGITVILLAFPWASIAPPYQFTENVDGGVDWLVPAVIIVLGTMLNAKLTDRMWLVLAWVGGFAAQAVIRGLLFGTSIPAALAMMTGVAFVLFSNYMISDPGTTPSSRVGQIAFGGGTAAMYGLLTALGVAYGIFFATALICLIRGTYLWVADASERGRLAREQEKRVDMVRDTGCAGGCAGACTCSDPADPHTVVGREKVVASA